MANHSNQFAQTLPKDEDEQPEVYSASQDQDGSFQFSRRDFLFFSLAVGGTLLVKGLCPRFCTDPVSTNNKPIQAGLISLQKVYLHAKPGIDSNILDTLKQDDIVLLISDHPDLGWMKVSTRSGQQGWLMRTFVDFSRAFTGSSSDFSLSSATTPIPTSTHTPTPPSTQLSGKVTNQKNEVNAKQIQFCGNAIQNGNFEAGHVNWIEESLNGIITSTWTTPYQGSWVAWFCGYNNARDKLTQLFHVPADVQDSQTLEFYIEVTTLETLSGVFDTFVVRFLNSSGTPICPDIKIADNTTTTDWARITVQFNGFNSFAGQDIKLQFEGDTDNSKSTDFVIDSVSLNLTCGAPTHTPSKTPTKTRTSTRTRTPTQTITPAIRYVFLPIVVKEIEPTSTNTPTFTPSPSDGPCPSHIYPTSNPCPANAYCPPVAHCPYYQVCTCNSAPCYCNMQPCSCNAYPCICNSYPYG